ncbi:right-handed parallel beta-helix repeat-containing protein [Paenibacillaceae bacterium]|nr:right-handed parallel beta-helix repeat-containing protein [Paenibacillaceae bacterium]
MFSNKIIYIRDYTQVSDEDSAAGIREAIQTAVESGAERVVFEPGRYKLMSVERLQTEGMVHDAGSGNEQFKECHLTVNGSTGLTLQGAVDEYGHPATVLVGYNDGTIHGHLPAILWCEDNERLALRNIAFTREPAFASAGVVIAHTEASITVEVFAGNPCYEGMGTYCMNRLDPATGALIGESVTYGGGADAAWKQVGERTLVLHSESVAAKVRLGEYLSWHQGAQTDFQTYFARCDHLELSNVRIMNANGFAMLAESCRHIKADRVVFKPDGNRLFTAPRDAWKLFKCGGQIDISRMYVEGVRMDGQNIQSNWLFFQSRVAADEALFFGKYTFAELLPDSHIEFYNGEHMDKRVIADWTHEGKREGGHLYRIRFTQAIPDYTVQGSLCAADCWEADSYVCVDSEFVNIAGAGHLVRNDHVTIKGCTYRNTMNPGILLGAELPTHAEGGHATNIHIEDCEFDHCGFYPRYGASGCIGIKSSGFEGKHNRHITIIGNRFRNASIGIHAIDADDVTVKHNHYTNVDQMLVIQPGVTGKIHVE